MDRPELPAEWSITRPLGPGECRFCLRMGAGVYRVRMHLPEVDEHAPEWERQRAGEVWRLSVSLCARHYAILCDAGERGRLHAQSRIRYWLLEGDA